MGFKVDQDEVATITMTGRTMNSFDVGFLRRLRHAFRELLEDPGVAAIVLTGEGKAFSAGADIAEFQAAIDDGRAAQMILDATAELHPMLHQIHHHAKPVVAAINGVAAGGGLGLALAAHARIGTRDARFAAGYFGIGASPDGGATWFLPRLIGVARARRFLFDNEVIGADEAKRLGLLDEIVDEDLMARAVALARRWAASSEHSREATNRLLAMTFHNDLPTQLEAERGLIAASAGTEPFRRGVAAFLAKQNRGSGS